MIGAIKAYVSRYVVPFYFDYEDQGYLRIVKHFRNNDVTEKESLGLPKDSQWVEKGFWESYKNDKDSRPEMDTYSYLLEVLKDDSNSKREANLGSSFMMKTNGPILNNLQYVPDSTQAGITFKCNELGVLMFRNGIGFLWYGIEFGKIPDADQYIVFQHDFKELARTYSGKFKKKTGKDTYDDFHMGKWIATLLNAEVLGIHFWAEKKTERTENEESLCVPDMALLFQYLFIGEAERKEQLELAFRTANGYDKKYNSPVDMKDKIYEPFGNACFFTSKSGTTYVVSDNDTNAVFFKDNFKAKYTTDYFFIYVLLLYQTYSSAHYSKLLTKLPAEVSAIESDKNNLERLESLDGQINLFLVKSVYESVSNVQHQNGVYFYGKESLHIEGDIKSLTIGLEALHRMEVERQQKNDQIQEKKDAEKLARKDRNLRIGLAFFGLLSVFSAGLSALNLVEWFKVNGDKMLTLHWVLLGVVAVLTVVMFGALIKVLVAPLKKSKKK